MNTEKKNFSNKSEELFFEQKLKDSDSNLINADEVSKENNLVTKGYRKRFSI